MSIKYPIIPKLHPLIICYNSAQLEKIFFFLSDITKNLREDLGRLWFSESKMC